MKQRDIGFRELLERVLPLEELPPADRLRVQRALSGGITREIEDAALFTIERLEEGGALRRVPVPPNGGEVVMRFQPRDALELITVHLPGPETLDGVTAFPRAALPGRAQAGLDQVRRLLRLDDPTLVAGPRDGQSRTGPLSQLEQVGRELLGNSTLTFHPAARPGNGVGPAGDPEPPQPAATPLDRALAEQALAHPGAIYYCADATKAVHLEAEADARGVRSLAVAGVVSIDGTGLGHLEVASPAPGAYGLDDLARIALLADYCGGLLERAERIEKLVFIDPLTTVYNRAYFDLQAQNELARARRDQASLALCIADIDNFKSFNTVFGYEAGNQVLMQVAQTLRGGVRPFDTVARWGGEEFAVLLAAPVQADAALAISERLRTSVERLRLRLEGLDRSVHQVAVTVSIGVALFPEHADSPQDLWRAANQALLSAKSGRKNQVIFFQPPRGAGA
ncbi:MAG: GGDEF domain-containing protein [Candidatus Eisenbacteria bacterium]